MRNRFDEQLFELNREIIEMGAMCEEAIASAAKALTTGDMTLAANVCTDLNEGAFVKDQAHAVSCTKAAFLCERLLTFGLAFGKESAELGCGFGYCFSHDDFIPS